MELMEDIQKTKFKMKKKWGKKTVNAVLTEYNFPQLKKDLRSQDRLKKLL